MYRKMPVFECLYCKKLRPGRINPFTGIYELPFGWGGSMSKKGIAFCDSCSAPYSKDEAQSFSDEIDLLTRKIELLNRRINDLVEKVNKKDEEKEEKHDCCCCESKRRGR